MQLDKTRIAVRERSYLDILDLALRVFRFCAGPLTLILLLGIVPMFLLNTYLLADHVEPDFDIQSLDLQIPLGYMVLVVFMVMWEIPLATSLATLYLGQVVFEERPSASRMATDFFKSLPQLFLYQVVVRGILVWPVVTWLWLFTHHNHLNEVILLERNRMRQKSPNQPSTGRRCQTLHSGIGGDLFARWMGSVAVGSFLLLSFWGSIWFFSGLLSSEWEITNMMFTHGFHVALWLVVGFFVIVRFLGYLDVRIRREGWEVELVMRAESQRLAGPDAG